MCQESSLFILLEFLSIVERLFLEVLVSNAGRFQDFVINVILVTLWAFKAQPFPKFPPDLIVRPSLSRRVKRSVDTAEQVIIEGAIETADLVLLKKGLGGEK